MPSSIAVLLPVLDRPHRVQPLCESLAACSEVIHCLPVFIVSNRDSEEIKAVEAAIQRGRDLGQPVWAVEGGELEPGDYARKVNLGAGVAFSGSMFVRTDFAFIGADDLYFHPGWAERAVAAWYETGACVIGTNDLANPMVKAGKHATHCLVHSDYMECGTIDEPGKLLHEGYHHNFVDNEFVETALARDTFHFAHDAHVEHSHPIWGTAKLDATYERGRSNHDKDAILFHQRRELWS